MIHLLNAVQQYSNAVKLTMAGNSLVVNMAADNGGGSLVNLDPVNKGVILSWKGVNGINFRTMNGLDGDTTTNASIDASFDPTKINIMGVLEGTNSGNNSLNTGINIWNDCVNFCKARLAIHPEWKILLMCATPGLQPTDSETQRNQRNANLDFFNNKIRNNFREAGAIGFTDIRYAGGPFDYPNYDVPTFETSNTPVVLWSTTDNVGQHIHLSTAGGRYHMRLIANALKRLPLR